MKKSDALKQERTAIEQQQQTLIDAAKSENRDFTDAENQEFDARMEQIRALDTKIERALSVEAVEARNAANNATPVANGLGNGQERELDSLKKRYSIHKTIGALNAGRSLEGVEKELDQEYRKIAERSGIAISGFAVPMANRAAGQTVTQDSGAYGANMVATETQDVIELLRPKLMLEQLGATYLTGLVGNLKFPKNNGGVVATWEGEVDTVGNTKNAVGSFDFTPKRLASSVLISLQNLMQTNYAIERLTIEDMNRAIAQALESAAINGTGTGQPKGILNYAGIGSVVAGTNGGDPTFSHVVGLETAVANANADANTMAYLINSRTRGKLKTTPKVSGQPMFIMGEDGMVNGYKAGVSNLVPSNLTKGTSNGVCSAGIFGDFSQLLIGTWAFLDLSIDNVSQKKNGYIELTVNSFNDVAVRHEESFAAVKDWLTV